MKKYFPILLCKPGEITALSHLTQNVKDDIVPIIEVIGEGIIESDGSYKSRLETDLINIWSFDDNKVFLDFSLLGDVDAHIPKIRRLFTNLMRNGVNVVPVVQFNSSPRYLTLIQNIIATHKCGLCIRENNNSGGFINYNAQVAAMIAQMNVTENETHLLIDLGFVEAANRNILATLAQLTINSLHNINNWATIIVSSGSFPTDLGGLPAPATNRSNALVHRLPRYEWDVWTVLNALNLPREIQYSDYGTKHPYFTPGGYEGSCSIKYTRTHEFLIYRGRKGSEHARGGNQYNDSASRLITSADFYGQPFSWGDDEIFQIGSRADRPGNAGKWVQISQNHHITVLHSLL